MEEYKRSELIITEFDDEDVITTSEALRYKPVEYEIEMR